MREWGSTALFVRFMLISYRLEGNVEGSRLDTKSDEELLREVHYTRIHRQAIDRQRVERGHTPEPVAELSIAQSNSLDSFGASPERGEDFLCPSQSMLSYIVGANPEFPEWPFAPEQTSFLLDSSLWTAIGSRQIHVRFRATYDQGRWTSRIGVTCPSAHTGPQGQTETGAVALEMTNKKSARVTDVVDVQHLYPAPPTKKNLDCVPLQGDHRSRLAKVWKINQIAQTATLVSHSSNSEKWDEKLDNLCWVN